jgi:multidrug efflux pump subunit AcrA (membrane-fusion protein)
VRLFRAALIVVLVGGLSFASWRLSNKALKKPPKSKPVPVATARRMDLDTALLVTGALEPAGLHPIVAVEGRGKIAHVVQDGSIVEAGDVIVQLDSREIEEHLNPIRDQMQQARQRLADSRTEAGRRLENAKSAVAMAEQKIALTKEQNAADLERAQAQLDQVAREREYADGQLAKTQRLFDQGLATSDQLDQQKKEQREQAFAAQKAATALANTRRQAEEKERSASVGLEKAQLDLTAAQIGSRRTVEAAQHALEGLQTQVEEGEREMRGCTLRTGVPGLVLLGTSWDEGGRHPLRVGDEVWTGMQVARVVDPNRVRVNCEIEEIDIRRIQPHQKVRLRVGTARGVAFPGTLESIDNIAIESPWWHGGNPGRRTFTALVAVEASDKRLKPGTTAWLEIVVENVKGKIAVPLQAVFHAGGETVVYRKVKAGFQRVPVTLGPRNDLYCAVMHGLRDGDRVAIVRPPTTTARAGSPKAGGT